MERLAPLALAVLAVFALATVATSLDQVSTEPTIESDTTPTAVETGPSGAGGGGTGTPGPENDERPEPTEATAASGGGSGPQVPLWQVAAGLSLFLVGSAVALYGLTRGEDDDTGEEQAPPEPTALSADRAVLGESVPATNDVYRAWAALCRAVPLEPTGQTPADVAEAAVAAGHEPAPVAELTDTFCAVRYGEAEPTEQRERRARELAATLSLEVTP